MYSNLELDRYQTLENTKSCHLDGRYFNEVFASYPGLIKNPLEIYIIDTPNGVKQGINLDKSRINTNYPGLLRVIITTNDSRHSNLLILDYQGKKIFRYDPYGKSHKYYQKVNEMIKDYLGFFMDFTLIDINEPVIPQEKTEGCERSGFCVGYVIKFAYDYLNKRKYDPNDIRKFAKAIENNYKLDNSLPKDIEYGFMDDSGNRNLLLGAVGGGLVGGLATGSVGGALGGAALGGLLGYGIGGGFN